MLEQSIFLLTIFTFLEKFPGDEKKIDLIIKFAALTTEANVGAPCKADQDEIFDSLSDFNILFELGKKSLQGDRPGLFFFFFNSFLHDLELWKQETPLQIQLKLFNLEWISYDFLKPFGFDH